MILAPALEPTAARPHEAEHVPALPARLQNFSRYLALVAEQLEAAQRHDAPRARELDEERGRLERTLVRAGGSPDSDLYLSALLDAGLRELEDQDDLKRAEDRVWLDLETGALRAAHTLRPGRPRVGRYTELQAAAARVDVRF